jgi:hypothetical protein
MGIMSLFRNCSPEDVYKEIASKIVVSALAYRTELDETNPQLTGNAGAEIAYLLLHLVDRTAFQILGAAGHDETFDAIAKIVISDYARALFRPTTPSDVVVATGMKMLDDMNDRQSTYAACQSLMGDPWPSRGTMVFACGYFVHRALGRTDRTDVGSILRGDRDVAVADMDAFPDVEQTLKQAVYIGAFAAELKLADRLKRLR